MSKLAIVLCATAFFATVRALSSFHVPYSSLIHDQIDYEITEVRNKLQELHQQSSILDSETSKRNYEVIKQFTDDVTKDLEKARPMVDGMIRDANTTFNETECRSYLIDYETTGHNILRNLRASVIMVIESTVREMREAIAMTTEALGELEKLKTRAITCQGLSCYKVDEEGGIIFDNVKKTIKPILCRARNLTVGSNVTEIMHIESLYEEYLEKGRTFLDKTSSCINSL